MINAVSPDKTKVPTGIPGLDVRADVEEHGAKVILLDSLNGYLQSMGEERFVNLQLHELLTYLNQLGVATMMVVTPQGLLGTMQSPLDVTYLADTVVTLRFFEMEGAVHKAISVVKRRTGTHEYTIRELMIEAGDISVGPPLKELRGVLTGVPQYPERKKEQQRPKGRGHEKKRR